MFLSPYDNPHSIHHMTIYIPFPIWQSTFHSPYNSRHSIHHKIRTVSTPFIIWQSPLHSSYDSLYSLHSIHHMVVSALFITWLFYSSHASLHSIHHMTVCSIHHNYDCSASNKSLFYLSPGEPSSTYWYLVCLWIRSHSFVLCLLITWWTMQHLLVFGMSMKNKS